MKRQRGRRRDETSVIKQDKTPKKVDPKKEDNKRKIRWKSAMKERAKARSKEEAENGGEIQIAKESPIIQICLNFKAAHKFCNG